MNSDHDNQDRFQDRLSRIQEKHASIVEREELAQPKKARRKKRSGSGRGAFLGAMAIPVLMAGVGFAYVKYPEKFSLDPPKAAVAEAEPRVKIEKAEGSRLGSLVAGMNSRSSVVNLSGKKTSDDGPRKETDHGPILQSPLVLSDGDAELLIEAVAAGMTPLADGAAPASVTLFDRQAECTFRRPAEGEKVIGVNVAFAQTPLPLEAFTDEKGVASLVNDLKRVTLKGKDTLEITPYDGSVRGVDVFVTDTSGPIYLVLQTWGRATVWNVHTAPGVDIAHVAMIGEQVSGLIAPEGTSHEGLIAGDFVEDREYGADDEIRPCMVVPWRAPTPQWRARQKADNDNLLYVNQMESFTKGRAAYAAWYESAFGVTPDVNEIETAGAAYVLVGPVPDAPLTYRSFDGAALSLMRTDHVVTGSAAERTAQIDQYYADLLTAALGADLSALRPEPVLRAAEVSQ